MGKVLLLVSLILLSIQSVQAGIVAEPPTEFEQYSLMLINRARADQDAEATRLGLVGGVNEGTSHPRVVTPGFKQPLAFDLALMQLACDWNMELDQINGFVHDSNSNRSQRAIDFGFEGDTGFINENLAVNSSVVMLQPTRSRVAGQHEALFVDDGVFGRGHRLAMLDETYQVIGISIRPTMGVLSPSFHDVLQVQNFASYSGSRFLTGAVFNDVDGDMFYTPGLGESLSNFQVEARALDNSGTLMTTTWDSGGYSLELDPLKSYELTLKNASGQLIENSTMTLNPGVLNFEYTFMNPTLAATSPVPEPASFGLFLILGLCGFLKIRLREHAA